MTEAYANALQTIMGEFKNISPEITKTFMFKANGVIVASDETTSEEQSKSLVAAFNGVSGKSEIIGGIETVTIKGVNRQLSITSMDNRFLATVSSREVDEKIIKGFTHVVKLVDEIASQISENGLPQNSGLEGKPVEEPILPIQEPLHTELIPEEPATFGSEPPLPEAPVTQFMIEKIGGLLVPSDTVRVNSEVITKWSSLYGDKQITEIHIETLEGKTITCKFKSAKEASNNVQGIIQIPEKILQTLQTSKGKLVIVKPVIT